MGLVLDRRNSVTEAQGRELARGHVESGSLPELTSLEKLPGRGPRSHGERGPAWHRPRTPGKGVYVEGLCCITPESCTKIPVSTALYFSSLSFLFDKTEAMSLNSQTRAQKELIPCSWSEGPTKSPQLSDTAPQNSQKRTQTKHSLT